MKYISKVQILFYSVGTKFEISEKGDCYFASEHQGDQRPVTIPAGIVENYPNFFEPIIERWKPKKDEAFYFVNPFGEIGKQVGFKLDFHYLYFEFGNCFETVDQAREAVKIFRQTLIEFHKKLGEK